MPVEDFVIELVDALKVLHESTSDLLRLITEDRPYEHSLAHRFEHATSDVLGRLGAALMAASILQQVDIQRDRVQAMNALLTCQAEFNQAVEKLYNDLKSYDWLQDLFALADEHPQEWLGWAISIKTTLDQCNVFPIQEALRHGWQTFAIALGVTSTSSA